MLKGSGTITNTAVDTTSGTSALPTGRQRNSRQAVLIQAALQRADGFCSAQELFTAIEARGDHLGLTTVYRHLALLVGADRVDVVKTADGEALYRLCGPNSGDTSHHHHLVCRVCGDAVEIAAPQIETWIESVAATAGYTDTTHTVDVLGLCPRHST